MTTRVELTKEELAYLRRVLVIVMDKSKLGPEHASTKRLGKLVVKLARMEEQR